MHLFIRLMVSNLPLFSFMYPMQHTLFCFFYILLNQPNRPCHKYWQCFHVGADIQAGAGGKREARTDQLQVCLIKHIKVDRGGWKMRPGSCPLVKVSGEMFPTLDNQSAGT